MRSGVFDEDVAFEHLVELAGDAFRVSVDVVDVGQGGGADFAENLSHPIVGQVDEHHPDHHGGVGEHERQAVEDAPSRLGVLQVLVQTTSAVVAKSTRAEENAHQRHQKDEKHSDDKAN